MALSDLFFFFRDARLRKGCHLVKNRAGGIEERHDERSAGAFPEPHLEIKQRNKREFTGNSLPEEDRAAALGSLYFTAMKSGDESAYSWQPGKLPLGKVPPVLLSECYNDVKQMAAARVARAAAGPVSGGR